MKTTFEPGDRVIKKGRLDWFETPGRRGTFVAGPGEHPTERPGNTLVIGEQYALVQFDDGVQGEAQVVRLDDLRPEDKS